jgi:hypothetical protein
VIASRPLRGQHGSAIRCAMARTTSYFHTTSKDQIDAKATTLGRAGETTATIE